MAYLTPAAGRTADQVRVVLTVFSYQVQRKPAKDQRAMLLQNTEGLPRGCLTGRQQDLGNRTHGVHESVSHI